MQRSSTCGTFALLASVALALLLCACGSGSGGDGEPPAASAGSLTVTACTIATDAANCSGSIAWTTSNAGSPRVLLDAVTIATTASGQATAVVTGVAQTVTLLDGSVELDRETIVGACVLASAWDGNHCTVFAVRTSERASTTFVENGQPVTLEVVLYTPLRPGPYPAVLFNHGSTGNGDDPSQFRLTYTNESIAHFFAERGWLVAFPQRRGRGASDGLYDEGFTANRSRYSCEQLPATNGFERALADVDAALEWLRVRTDVDATRMLAAGTSRGGILAIAHAGQRPELFDGAVNFVGGWLGEGCQDAVPVNHTSFARGGRFLGPTLWLYGTNDSFYSVAHSNSNFAAFNAAGGRGNFNLYTRAPGLNGHFIINDADLWAADLAAFVRQLE